MTRRVGGVRRMNASVNWRNFASRSFGVRRVAFRRRLVRGQASLAARRANRAVTRGPYGPRRH